ncbi:MAG: hypothetical protein QOJ90_1345 [Actinomycetota bacterium]|jgi:hypothetical protein|nr:hypothetical protein [Actinomycetota bacterium]MDQ1641994.1 hypothetical protein [Actinomycetota bacterium]
MTDQPGSGEPVPPGWAPVQPPAYPPPSYGAPGSPPPGYPPPGAPPQPGWGAAPGWGAHQPGWTPPPKPGVVPLRPLGVGEILDGAISTLRAHPRTMLGFSALVAVASQILIIPVTWLLLRDAGDLTIDQTTGSSSDAAFAASSFSAAALQGVVTLIATLILTGVLTVVVSRAVLGQAITTAEAWRLGRPRLPALFGVTGLVFLLAVGLAVVCLAPGIAVAAAGGPGVAIALLLIAGIPAFLVAMVYFYVAFALAPAVVVLERQGVIASLLRSRRLVKTAWWRTFGLILLVNVIAQLLSGVLSTVFSIAALATSFLSGNGLQPYSFLPLVISGVGAVVASTITWPFTAAATVLIYVDRRMRREGLDMELTRAAGLTPVGESATPGVPPAGYGPAR